MLTGLPWRPIITYGSSPTTIELTLPQKLWSYGTQLQGASSIFSGGNVAAYRFREDNRAKLTLRVRDCVEYLDVRTWLMDAMLGNTFTFQFDADDPTSEFTCRLDAPAFKDGFKPRRMSDWPDVWEIDVTIRNTNALPIFLSVAQTCEINSTGNSPLIRWVLTDIDAGGGRFVLALSAPYGGGPFFYDDPTTVWDPSPISSLYLSRSDTSVVEFISRPLSAGVVNAFEFAQLGGLGPGDGATTWRRAGANITVQQVRSGVEIGPSFTSADMGFGFLGGGSHNDYSLTGAAPMRIRSGDQILLKVRSYLELQPMRSDNGYRTMFDWGNPFGPLQTTYMYAYSDVTELP